MLPRMGNQVEGYRHCRTNFEGLELPKWPHVLRGQLGWLKETTAIGVLQTNQNIEQWSQAARRQVLLIMLNLRKASTGM